MNTGEVVAPPRYRSRIMLSAGLLHDMMRLPAGVEILHIEYDPRKGREVVDVILRADGPVVEGIEVWPCSEGCEVPCCTPDSWTSQATTEFPVSGYGRRLTRLGFGIIIAISVSIGFLLGTFL
jgi:hypothetical protein